MSKKKKKGKIMRVCDYDWGEEAMVVVACLVCFFFSCFFLFPVCLVRWLVGGSWWYIVYTVDHTHTDTHREIR